MKKHNIGLVIGILLVSIGVGLLARVPYFYYRSKWVGEDLVQQMNQKIAGEVSDGKQEASAEPINNHVIGKIEIPKLSLTAPLVEGTDEEQLEVSVGHLSASVLPGKKGTSVLAAHNATWFRHIDQLKPGDTVVISTTYGVFDFQVVHTKVVHQNDEIESTSVPSVILESCYPLDAKYLTQERYLVYGELVKTKSYGQ